MGNLFIIISLFVSFLNCKAKSPVFAQNIEIERKSVINDTQSNIFLSIDKFTNHEGISNDESWKQQYCETRNATCNGKSCNYCACKDFQTFHSYNVGCVSKLKGDRFLGGKIFIFTRFLL